MIAATLGLLTLVRYPAVAPATVSVSPQTALLDEPVAVSVRGLPAGATATVSATAVDAGGTTWTAAAEFEVSPDGAVTLDQPSLGGSYSGVNAMGLFQFMAPPSGSTETTFFSPPSEYDVVLQVRVGRRLYATATVRRQGAASVGVIKKDFRPASSGIYGSLFLPGDTQVRRHPGVLVFGGSDGGLGRTFVASLLAAHGYPALAVAYFGVPGLPQSLAEIPLEYFVKAIRILRAQPGVDPQFEDPLVEFGDCARPPERPQRRHSRPRKHVVARNSHPACRHEPTVDRPRGARGQDRDDTVKIMKARRLVESDGNN